MKIRNIIFLLMGIACIMLCSCKLSANDCKEDSVDVVADLAYCHKQVQRTLQLIENDSCMLPRSINTMSDKWNMTNAYDWTSGFWPGILWYDYENTGDESVKKEAEHYTNCLADLLNPEHPGDHDLGFQFFCSFVNAYRITGDPYYKKIALAGADKLAAFFNPKVGTILSWPHMEKEKGWPHNTIMDNMMNLDLLFWAARNGNNKDFYRMAESHARVTMQHQFRPDYTNYHVAIYDTVSGNFIKGLTNQGYSDESCWSRGQAWAIYGFTMVYRETGNKEYLRFAEKLADAYLTRLPDDYVPYWDFDAPDIQNQPKDVSAAAVCASALLELSSLEDNEAMSEYYWQAAEHMLNSLASDYYRCGNQKTAFLLHATGNMPAGYEIDASINYADYYYIEALHRYKTLKRINTLSEKQ